MQGDIRFGRNLKILRSRKEISQQELADKIHVTRQTVSCWERGEGKPDIYCVNDICRIFKISMDEIVCGNVVKGEAVMDYEEKEVFTEAEYIKGIKEKGFYSINDEDLHEFFPIIEIDFPRIMVIAMALKRENYDVRDVYDNGFSLYMESDEKAEKFSDVLYNIIDSFIHHDNEYIEENLEKINQNIFTQDFGDRQTFVPNGVFITYDELSRIESAILNMYNLLDRQKAGLIRLAFRFGNMKGVQV